MARPTVLTRSTRAALLSALRRGAFVTTACASAGVGYSTFKGWMARGRSGDRPFARLRREVSRARALAEAEALARVRNPGPGEDWQGPAWFLSRSFPERWGRRRNAPARPTVIQPSTNPRGVQS